MDDCLPANLLAELAERAPRLTILTTEQDRARYATDALTASRAGLSGFTGQQLPAAVALPRSTRDVEALLAWAHQRRVPVVPFGGGTGVMGGAAPVQGGITIDLRHLNHIRRIAPGDGSVEVEAGAKLADVDYTLRDHGLTLAHDPWSRHIATVGGAIATNGMGYTAARYGTMGRQVLGLEVVLPGGRRLETRPLPVPGPGPDLNSLFIGSEGVLGIITAAVVRAYPLPEERQLVGMTFRGFAPAWSFINALLDEGLGPSVIDLGEEDEGNDGQSLTVISRNGHPQESRDRGRHHEPWLDGTTTATLFLGYEGPALVVAAAVERTNALARDYGASLLPQEEATRFWQHRHDTADRFAAQVEAQPDARQRAQGGSLFEYLCLALPPSKVPTFRREAVTSLSQKGMRILEFGLWASREFVSIAFDSPEGDPGREEDRLHLAHATAAVIDLAHGLGGSMEFCHGAGLKLAPWMPADRQSGWEVLRTIKRALDPHGIMNPGKLGL